jgi:hypothetical protein
MSKKEYETTTKEVIEEITVKGSEALEYVKNLIQKGNIRSLVVRKSDGTEIVTIPLTGAVVGAGALLVFAAPLAILGAAVAFLMEVKLEIVRLVEDDEEVVPASDTRKNKIDIE